MDETECAVDTGFMRTAHQMIEWMKQIQNQRKEMDHRRLDRDTARAAMANAPVEKSAQMVDAYNHAKDQFELAKARLEAGLTDLMNKEGEVIQALASLVEAQQRMYVIQL
jgi:predicted  nucleic acid-binding Zn-ribbon protein